MLSDEVVRGGPPRGSRAQGKEKIGIVTHTHTLLPAAVHGTGLHSVTLPAGVATWDDGQEDEGSTAASSLVEDIVKVERRRRW